MENTATDCLMLENAFLRQFKGTFHGLLYWPDVECFWQVLKAKNNNDWYIYKVGELPPTQPAVASELVAFIDETDVLLKALHEHDFCGLLYVDDQQNPNYVKIYHPKNMGYGACSIEKKVPFPRWILSTLPPADITVDRDSKEKVPFWKKIALSISGPLLAKEALK